MLVPIRLVTCSDEGSIHGGALYNLLLCIVHVALVDRADCSMLVLTCCP